MKLDDVVEVDVGDNIAVDNDERPITKKILYIFYSACCSKDLFFLRKVKIEVGRRRAFVMIDDTFRKVMNVDRDIADTSLAQQIERVGEKRAA